MVAITNPVNDEFLASSYNSSNFAEQAGDWITKGVPLAVSSGIAGLWNGVATLGNGAAHLLGTSDDTSSPFGEELDSTFLVNNFDDAESYKSYYQQHQDGIDLGGFMLSSLVPSSLAIKGLRAAQAGFAVSRASSAVTGLLSNSAERFWLNKAALNLANGASPLVPRVAAGLSKGVQIGLEGMVGEAANYAVQYQNPFYSDIHDFGDFLTHELVLGASLGGLGAGFGTWLYKGTKFALQDGAGLATGVKTSIGEVEKLVGKATHDAAFTSLPNQFAGRSLEDSAQSLVTKQAQAAKNLYGMLPEAGVVFTAGDDAALAYSAIRRQAVRTAKDLGEFEGSPLAEALKTRVGAIGTTLSESQNTLLNNLYTALDDGTGAAGLARTALEANGESAVREALVGATKISRATLKDGAASNKVLLSLENGAIDTNAILTAGDLGKVKVVSSTSVKVGDDVWNLTAKSKEALAALTPEKAHIKYEAEFQHFNPEDVQKAIPSWNLPKLEASYRKTGKIFVSETTESVPSVAAKDRVAGEVSATGDSKGFRPRDATETTTSKKFYTGADALDYIRQEKIANYMELVNTGASDVEARTRLNLGAEVLVSPNPVESSIINVIDGTVPRHVSITQPLDKDKFNLFRVQAAANLEAKHRVFQEANDVMAEQIFKGEINFPEFNLADHDGVNAAAGIITGANAGYNTVSSKIQHVGGLVQRWLIKQATEREAQFLNIDQALLRTGNGSAEAVELASIIKRVTGAETPFYLQDGKLVSEGVEDLVINSPMVKKYLETYIQQDGKRLADKNLARIARGEKVIETDSRLYFPPPHPSELNFKAMVRDTDGNVGMIWAKDKAGLEEKVRLTQQAQPSWIIRTPDQLDSYYQLNGIYDDSLSLRGRLKVDSQLKRMGILSDVTPTTNISDLLGSLHSGFARAERQVTTDGIFLKYGQQLAEANMASTVLGTSNGWLKKVFNTLLNIEDKDNAWHQFSSLVESKLDWAGGKLFAAGGDVVNGRKSISQVEAETAAFEKGTQLFTSDALWNASKASSFTGGTQKLLRETNSLIRYAVLGVDYFNGLVNIIGQPVLLLPEIRAAMAAGSDVPYMKLVGNALKASMNKESTVAMIDKYEKLGIVSKDVLAHHELLDSHALMMGASNSGEASRLAHATQGKAKTFFNTLQKPTAYAERFTQLVAANIGEQVGISRGLVGADLEAFVTTFAKKVNGNYVSAQRPLLFQGVLGQAVGLFQTYQFNLFQQAARHYSDGNKKGLAAMAAIQGSIFGAQSLPGFELANRALLGQWNEERKDAFNYLKTGVDVAGLNTGSDEGALQDRDLGDWILYGGASSLLGANLWTRGDTNPRNITGIPVNPSDLAQVQYYAKALKGFGEFTSSILAGGNIKVSALEAISHANLSRPLSGAAELAMGAKTTAGGTLETALNNDLLSWSAAVRLLGAKPMQEAIATSETYKMGIVKAEEQKHLNEVGYALRSAMLADHGNLDEEAITNFSKKYIDAGGNPRGFRKWYQANLAKATTPRAQLFAQRMSNNPWANTYQEIAQPLGMDSLDRTTDTLDPVDSTVSP